MSLAQARIRSESVPHIRDLYSRIIESRLISAEGCLHAWLLKNDQSDHEYLTLSLWASSEAVERFVATADYGQMMTELADIMAEPTEWKMQLSESLTIEYVPISEEPVIDTYDVRMGMDPIFGDMQNPMFARVFSFRIRPEYQNDFVEAYRSIIIERLKAVTGCLGAYLCANRMNRNSFISVTLWQTSSDARSYEQGGTFDHLVSQVDYMFADLSTLVAGGTSTSVSSDDRRIERFEVVVET